MLNKKQIKKEAYKLIVKQGKSHQDTYDILRPQSSIPSLDVAHEVSKIPSAEKNEKYQVLRFIFIGALCAVIILRIMGTIAILGEMNINGGLIIAGILLGIVVPIVGIVGTLTSRHETYTMVGILLLISIFRSMTKEQLDLSDAYTWIALIPFIVAIFLAFFLMNVLKTPYKEQINKVVDENGNEKTEVSYLFQEEAKVSKHEVLDM